MRKLRSASTGVSGCLSGAGDTLGIFYSDSISSDGFRRFTVAHELGHYFLEKASTNTSSRTATRAHVSASGYTSDDPYEREADAFAAALLMPEGLFKSACGRVAPGFKAIESLSEECVTSLTATAIRYAVLSDDAIAVVGSTEIVFVRLYVRHPQTEARPDMAQEEFGITRWDSDTQFNGDPKNIAESKRVRLPRTWTCGSIVAAPRMFARRSSDSGRPTGRRSRVGRGPAYRHRR